MTSTKKMLPMAALVAFSDSIDWFASNLALIMFGREICQARRPQCEACPVYEDCDAEEKRPRSRRPKINTAS